jgi:hypothetical protein
MGQCFKGTAAGICAGSGAQQAKQIVKPFLSKKPKSCYNTRVAGIEAARWRLGHEREKRRRKILFESTITH